MSCLNLLVTQFMAPELRMCSVRRSRNISRPSVPHQFLLLLFVMYHLLQVQADQPLKVAFAGFSHSGTHSLEAALERLGYNACHGQEILFNARGAHKMLVDAMIDQDVDRILQVTSEMNYNATLELHGSFWRQIWEKRPQAKFIFIIRSFDRWMESACVMYENMSYFFWLLHQCSRAGQAEISTVAAQLNVSKDAAWEFHRKPRTEKHFQARKSAYEMYVKEAQQLTALYPEKALLFRLSDGYEPLCRFLGIEDCPTEDFPHLGTKNMVQFAGFILKAFDILLCILLVMLVMFVWRKVQFIMVRDAAAKPKKE